MSCTPLVKSSINSITIVPTKNNCLVIRTKYFYFISFILKNVGLEKSWTT